MQKRTLGTSGLQVSALGFGCMGLSRLRAADRRRTASASSAPPSTAASRSSTPQKCTGRSRTRSWSARPSARFAIGWSSPRSSASSSRAASRRASKPPRAHPRGGRGVVEAARTDGSISSTSIGSIRTSRSRTSRHGKGLIRRREGRPSAFRRRACRPFAAPSRSAGHGTAKRVLAVVAGAGARGPAGTRGAGDRLRPVQPAGQGIPDRQDRREDDLRQRRTSATWCPDSRRKTGRPTRRSSTG